MNQEYAGVNQSMPNKPKKSSKKALVVVIVSVAFAFGAGFLIGNDRVSVGDNTVNSLQSNSSTSDQLSTDGLQEIYTTLLKKYDGEVNPEDLLDGLKKGAVSALGDNYTEYMSPVETEEFNADLNGTFEGIGAELSQEDGFVMIVAPIKGTPAEKAGIRPRDIIIEIDGESSTDITVREAVTRIRGEKGTEVVLTVIRDGERVVVPIIRATIDIASVEWRVEDGVGIIEIARFSTDTTQLTQQAALEFKEEGISKVILDMRGNPGGLLDQAVGVSSVWLDTGSVVLEEKRGNEVIKTFRTSRDPVLSGAETVILINEGSASASEIVAGALKDNGAATLMGKTSFGKGSVQQLIDLKSGGSLKVTIARWYTPNGKNIDKEGIDPDTEVDITAEDLENDLDPQLKAAKNAF